MKNVHVLPTTQPSRLWIDTITGKLVLDKEPNALHSQHIYLTSDEEIKKGDYCIDGGYIYGPYEDGDIATSKFIKIILTTDSQLIRHGVQSIDNDFLEWFIKNPTCEFVEVEEIGPGFPAGIYWINYLPEHFEKSIPQEDHKQYPIGGFAPGNYWHKECVTCKRIFTGDKRAVQCEPCAIEMVNTKVEVNSKGGVEIVKQETLEEAAEKFYPPKTTDLICSPKLVRDAFITGANYKAGRMFSEDEVRALIEKALTHNDYNLCGSLVTKDGEIRTANFNIWFEENKKFMADTKTLIINQFEENKGQFVIMSNNVCRLVSIAEDGMDYYYVTYDGRKVDWHSCVGSYVVLKNKIDDKDYNEFVRLAKLNHYDQPTFFLPQTEEEKKKQLDFATRHKKLMETEDGENRYLTPFCWDLN